MTALRTVLLTDSHSSEKLERIVANHKTVHQKGWYKEKDSHFSRGYKEDHSKQQVFLLCLTFLS